ncbi:MAG: peptidoglycan-binding protein, partial [Patescibacteria group bacterium]
VLTLHTQLKELGYYTGELTDRYTAVTREAVRKFQNSEKITPTGLADAATRKRIEARIKAITTAIIPAPTGAGGEMKLGASGEAVRLVQVRLRELGYLTAEPTGYFGPLTHAAVVAFQTASGIDPIGVVGPKTKAALVVATPSTVPITASEQANVGTLVSTLAVGSRGTEVATLQSILKNAGYFHFDITDYFGPLTKAAVIAFQTANGIEPIGIVGPKTRAALNTL